MLRLSKVVNSTVIVLFDSRNLYATISKDDSKWMVMRSMSWKLIFILIGSWSCWISKCLTIRLQKRLVHLLPLNNLLLAQVAMLLHLLLSNQAMVVVCPLLRHLPAICLVPCPWVALAKMSIPCLFLFSTLIKTSMLSSVWIKEHVTDLVACIGGLSRLVLPKSQRSNTGQTIVLKASSSVSTCWTNRYVLMSNVNEWDQY